eukprot:1415167-Rhodomonas_salina.1
MGAEREGASGADTHTAHTQTQRHTGRELARAQTDKDTQGVISAHTHSARGRELGRGEGGRKGGAAGRRERYRDRHRDRQTKERST